MGNSIEINYYLFDGMISFKNFNPYLLKIDKTSYKNIDIYYIGYIIMKDHINIHQRKAHCGNYI